MHAAHDSERRSRAGVTPAQAIALGLVAAALGWSAWYLRDRPLGEEVELLAGTALPSSELAIVEAAFDRAQLSGHRTEDGRIWVPRARQSAYLRVLVDADALPREFGRSLRDALERSSPWQSRSAQEEVRRVALQEELAHVICSMPGIERAAVLYDVEPRGGWEGGLASAPARTASVNVRTQPDVDLEPARVQAIRVLVAASIAGLAPESVAVTDLRSGRVHAGPLEPATSPVAAAGDALARRATAERQLAAKVRQAVSFVKGAVVDVTVTLADPAAAAPDAAPELTTRQRVADANAPAEIGAGDVAPAPPVPAPAARADEPESVLVLLAVPEGHFEAAWQAARRRDPTETAAAVDRITEERLRSHVLHLLPTTRRPDGRQVAITRFAPAAARAETMTAGAASAGSPPTDLRAWFEQLRSAVAAGRVDDVPREAWLVVIAVAVTLLAWLLPRGGRPRRGSGGRSARRIDWSTLDAPAQAAAAEGSRKVAA